MARQTEQYPNGWPWLLAVTVYLSGKLLVRLMVTAGEYASRTTIWLDIFITIAVMWAAVHFARQVRAHPDSEPGRIAWANRLCGVAIVAGLGLLLLRLVPEHGWSTGHWSYDYRK